MTIDHAKSLARAFKKRFGGKVEFEAIDKKGRYRFAITSKQFDKMRHMQRQDRLWEIVDEVLPREETLDVSMILAFAPADLIATE